MFRAATLAFALFATAVAAQDRPVPTGAGSAILTITPDDLLAGTQAGATVASRYETATRALVTENRRIEAALEAEERELTARRAVTDPAEFQRIAAEFDTRVDAIRNQQDEKSRDLIRKRDADRQLFFKAIAPILGQLMEDAGAVAILYRESVFLSFDLIDVTDRAIAEIDEELGDGADIFAGAPAP